MPRHFLSRWTARPAGGEPSRDPAGGSARAARTPWALLLWATATFACDASPGLSSSLASATVAGAAGGAGEVARVALPPLPPLSGDRLLYRFCDHAGEATLDLAEPGGTPGESSGRPPATLRDRFLGFDSPYKMASPYSGLRGETALRVIEVAVAEPAVEKYPRPPEATSTSSATGETAPRFDPVWNRYRGVYESKVALFAPAPACYRYRLPLPARGLLSFHYAAIPPQKPSEGRTLPVEFSVSLDGKRLWSAQLGKSRGAAGSAAGSTPAGPPSAKAHPPGAPGHWLAGSVELPSDGSRASSSPPHEIAFCSTVMKPEASASKDSSSKDSAPRGGTPAVGTAVWGSPELWSLDEGAAGPNVLLVLIDTLRADALSAMPGLSKLGQDSVAFSQAITAATWTRPSLLGLLGGELATAVGQSAEEMIPSERERKRFYALDRRLLPRALRDAGYKVASIGNNFFLLGYPQIGLSLGFDEVADVRHPVEDTPAISRAAIAFLQSQASRGRSFFLQLHYDAPHWPYTPPTEHQGGISDAQVAQLMGLSENERAGARLDPQARAYLGEAAYADAQIGLVLAELDRLKLRERTLVIVVGDHGEVFDPRHNHYVQSLKQPTLYHHGWSAYDEILRVPLLLSMPGRLPGGTVVNSQVRLTDVAPTVLELLGLGSYRAVLPSGGQGDGQSLLPLIFSPRPGKGGAREPQSGDDDKLGRPAYAEGQNIRALRYAGYLYLRRGDARLQRAQGNDGVGPVLRVAEELYDLKADPYQHNDLLAAFYGPAKTPPREGSPSPGPVPQPTSGDPLADPRLGPILTRLREEFSRHTPQAPEQGLPLVHLMLAPDARAAHLLTGTLVSSDQGLAVQGVRNGEVVPRGPGRIELKLRPGGVVDVLVDPSARLELNLARDGLAVAPRELLLGPFSLPLIAGRGDGKATTAATPPTSSDGTANSAPIVLDGALLDRLSSSYAPVPGERGEILIWRDQTAPGLAAASTSQIPGGGSGVPGQAGTAKSAGEVETLMRDWGYARPATPTAPASTAPPGGPPKTSSPADGGP